MQMEILPIDLLLITCSCMAHHFNFCMPQFETSKKSPKSELKILGSTVYSFWNEEPSLCKTAAVLVRVSGLVFGFRNHRKIDDHV